MKKSIFFTILAVFIFGTSSFAQQTEKKKVVVAAAKAELKKETFRVYGNCSMCERAIEYSTKAQEGIKDADWDKKTDQFTVTFDPTKITLEKIKQQLANIGYDTETHRAKDEVYNALPGCCQYDRPEPLKVD